MFSIGNVSFSNSSVFMFGILVFRGIVIWFNLKYFEFVFLSNIEFV